MSSSFGIIFSIQIAHDYYPGVCSDFEFRLLNDSSQIARNGRMICRERDGVFYMLAETKDDESLLLPVTGETLRIALLLRNANFSNFTQSVVLPGSFPLYRNAASPLSLNAPRPVKLNGPFLQHPLSKTERPVTISLFGPDGSLQSSEVLPGPEDSQVYTADMRDFRQGLYLLKEEYAVDSAETDYYLDQELIQMSAFGVIEIKLDEALLNARKTKFTLNFAAREETLKYYIVGKRYSQSELEAITVADAGAGEEGRSPILFNRVNQPAFTKFDISPDILAPAGSSVVLFKSQSLVARNEKPRKKIQLSKSSDIIIKHLPQPGQEQSNSEMIIQISKP